MMMRKLRKLDDDVVEKIPIGTVCKIQGIMVVEGPYRGTYINKECWIECGCIIPPELFEI